MHGLLIGLKCRSDRRLALPYDRTLIQTAGDNAVPYFLPRLISRTATGRMAALAIVAAGVATLGAGVLPRLIEAPAARQPNPWVSAQPASAEPDLFHFPAQQETLPPVLTPSTVEAARASTPSRAAKSPVHQAALPANVERFEPCRAPCERNDPARRSVVAQPTAPANDSVNASTPAQGPLQISPQLQAQAPDVPRPPLPVGTQAQSAPPSPPNLFDRSLKVTYTLFSSITDQMKTTLRAP